MTEILLNDFKRQWEATGSQIQDAVGRVGRSGWYILGNEVAALEKNLSPYFGNGGVAGCASGLDALELSLRAMGIQVGDKVLTTPLSAFATTLAILKVGAVPVFVDVDELGLIDLDRAEEAIQKDCSIKWMIPVHLFGFCLDLTRLQLMRSKYGIKIIEDCAQSIGAKYQGICAGQIGDAAATSFYPTKNLGCIGDGGAAISTNSKIIDKIKQLRDYGQAAKYEHAFIGMNSRLDELQAAILTSAMLPSLPKWTERRRQIASTYLERIKTNRVTLLQAPHESYSVWHLFPIIVDDLKRDSLQKYLKENNVSSAVHYPKIIPEQPAMANVDMICLDQLQNARKFANNELSLPIHPFLSDDEIERVVDCVNGWGE